MPRNLFLLLCSLLTSGLLAFAARADVPENIKDILKDPVDLESEAARAQQQHWELKLRNVYFYKNRKKTDASPAGIDQWGQAAELNYFNGDLSEHLDVEASLYGALKLRGDDDNRSSDIFEKKSDGSLASGYGKVGQLFARIKYDEHNFLRLGASQLNYLGLESSGSRATPSTFVNQAIHLGGTHWQAYYARTDRWSARHLSEYSGFRNNSGETIDQIQILGASFDNDTTYIQFETGESKDYLQRSRLSGGYRFPLGQGSKIDLNLAYLTAKDAGDLYDSTFGERRAGTGLDGKKYSISAEYQSEDVRFGVMLGRNGDDGYDHYWYQGDHGTMKHWHERQVSEFVAANAKIFHAQYTQINSQRLPGFEWSLSFTHGRDAKASLDFQADPNNPNLSGSEWEVDLAVKYDFSEQGLSGLSVQFITGYYRNTINEFDIWNNENLRSNANETDNRLYIDYAIAF